MLKILFWNWLLFLFWTKSIAFLSAFIANLQHDFVYELSWTDLNDIPEKRDPGPWEDPDPGPYENLGPYEDPGPYDDPELYEGSGHYEDPGPYEDSGPYEDPVP